MSDQEQEQEKKHDHLLELAHGYIERSLTPAQVSELETLLSENPEARRIYLDFMHDHASLHCYQIGQDTADDEITDLSDYRPSRFPSLWQAFAAAAVIALLCLVMVRPKEPLPTFATMKKTESARWESGTLPTADGARLSAGELFLAQGLATISFDRGAEVILEAPAKLTLVDAMNCVLTSGTAVAEVAKSAEGFAITTPGAKVIDHGTRFAINVHPTNGATQTQVFEGLVEVELNGGKERIELRAGQRNLVEGRQMGKVSEGSDEATWTLPDAIDLKRDKNTITLSTADPGGADAYVWAGNPNGHNSETLLLLKNAIEKNGPHRKSYLRFDLGAITSGSIQSARLDLQFTATGWGLASHLGASEFVVYGIIDDTLDNWNAENLNWANAPANTIENGTSLMPEKVVRLGTFSLPRGIQSGSFGIDGKKLASFLNADKNRKASLVVVRNTGEIRGGGLVHAFSSSRHPTLPAPTLVLKMAE